MCVCVCVCVVGGGQPLRSLNGSFRPPRATDPWHERMRGRRNIYRSTRTCIYSCVYWCLNFHTVYTGGFFSAVDPEMFEKPKMELFRFNRNYYLYLCIILIYELSSFTAPYRRIRNGITAKNDLHGIFLNIFAIYIYIIHKFKRIGNLAGHTPPLYT